MGNATRPADKRDEGQAKNAALAGVWAVEHHPDRVVPTVNAYCRAALRESLLGALGTTLSGWCSIMVLFIAGIGAQLNA